MAVNTQRFQKELVSTLSYAEVFESEATRWVLERYWHGPLAYPRHVWLQAIKQHQDTWRKGWLSQPGTLPRESQHTLTSSQLAGIALLVHLVRWIPSINSLWLTGSAAIRSRDERADLDFMVVCRSGTLWSTRLLVSVAGVILHQLRRREDQHVRGRWCFNYWLEQEGLQQAAEQQNLYQAREIVQAVPLYQRQYGLARALLLANSWVLKYTRSGWLSSLHRADQCVPRRSLLFFLPGVEQGLVWILRRFNRSAFRWQQQYMLRHGNTIGEAVALHRAAFHHTKRAVHILTKYETIRRSIV